MASSSFNNYCPVFLWTVLYLVFGGCQNHSERKDFAQYDPLVWSAMIAYEDQNYELSLSLFQQAFQLISNDSNSDLMYAAAAALNLGKADIAENLIRTAIINTNPNKNYLDSFYGFIPFKSSKIFVRVNEDYEELVAQYYSQLPYPKSIEDEIIEMTKKDQEVRLNGDWDSMAMVDSLNINRLIEITEQYGWIKKAWIILWHQRGVHREDNRIWNYFRPLIEKEIAVGKIRKDFWAIFDDELSIRNSKSQIYGMYQDQFPVKDVEKVDERRQDLGLPPLWYLHKVYGQDLPTGYSTDIKDLDSFMKVYLPMVDSHS